MALVHPAQTVFLASGNINVGDHVESVRVFGQTIDLDIVWSTCVAAAIVIALGLVMARRATVGMPGKLQLFWETIVEQVQDLTDSAIGEQGRRFVPLAVAIFLFILICNWLAFIPSGHPEWLPAPTSDVNLPVAMALTVIFLMHYNSIKARGLRGYLHHYVTPFKALLPINVIEEITKPITLTFRLFGNLFSGALMVTVIVVLPAIYFLPAQWAFLAFWKVFDELFIGAIQAFIFALLTIIYLGMGMSTDEH